MAQQTSTQLPSPGPVPPTLPVPPKRPFARHNLRTVVDFEFTRTMKKRAFWIATLSIPVVMAIVFALVYLSNSSTAASEDAQKTAAVTFTYTDDSGLITPDIATAMGGTKATDPGQALQDVKAGVTDAYFAYPAEPASQPVKVYGTDKGIFENGKYDAVAKQLLTASAQAAVGSPQLTAAASGDVKTESQTFKDGQATGGFGSAIPPLMFLLIFYVSIILLSNQMLNSTLEEKENRVTEMILTTLNPTTLIIGKVIALFMVGLIQILVFLTPIVVGVPLFPRQTRHTRPGPVDHYFRSRDHGRRGAAAAGRVHGIHRCPGRNRGDHAYSQRRRHDLRAPDGLDLRPVLRDQPDHLRPARPHRADLHVLPALGPRDRPSPQQLWHPQPA